METSTTLPASPKPRRSARIGRILLWTALGAIAATVVIVVIGLWMLQPAKLKSTVEQKLSDRLGLAVTIEDLSFAILPRPQVAGRRLIIRVPSRPDLEPFLTIQSFWVNVGVFSAWRRHVGTVHVDGMEIVVPPGQAARDSLTGGGNAGSGAVVVEHLVAHDARLSIVRRKPGHPPLVFQIHDLQVDDVGFDREMSYAVELTNPIPEGLVKATGLLGPWQRGDPAALPVSGDYTFTRANLDTIKGIAGMLNSEGKFDGRLTAIAVKGHSETPDFNLDLGGKPVPLVATFDTIVDGSNGTVQLNDVDAKLLNTRVRVTGKIENLPGPGRHAINLNAEVIDGHIEDILALAIDADKPMMTGKVRMKTSISLPPGPRPLRQRLGLAGTFALDSGRFTNAGIEQKLREFSRRSQGKQDDPEAGVKDRVFTQMSGQFKLAAGTMHFTNLKFGVPGALVSLDGTYALPTTEIAMAGTLRMDATVSQAIGGLKSFFLKPFDRLFRRDGAGAVVPIRITGTREAPKTGLQFGKVFSGGK